MIARFIGGSRDGTQHTLRGAAREIIVPVPVSIVMTAKEATRLLSMSEHDRPPLRVNQEIYKRTGADRDDRGVATALVYTYDRTVTS